MIDPVILLVEDNDDDVELTLRAFRRSRISNQIVVATDGVHALDLLLGRNPSAHPPLPELPQLVLLDLHLPKLDGLAVLQALRAEERTRQVPIVIFTSSNEEEDRVKSYNLGANSFVRKPLDFAQFERAVKELSLYWIVVNEASRQR